MTANGFVDPNAESSAGPQQGIIDKGRISLTGEQAGAAGFSQGGVGNIIIEGNGGLTGGDIAINFTETESAALFRAQVENAVNTALPTVDASFGVRGVVLPANPGGRFTFWANATGSSFAGTPSMVQIAQPVMNPAGCAGGVPCRRQRHPRLGRKSPRQSLDFPETPSTRS